MCLSSWNTTDVSLILLAISYRPCVTRTHRLALVTDVTSSHPAKGSSTHYYMSVVSPPHGSVASVASPARGQFGTHLSLVNACNTKGKTPMQKHRVLQLSRMDGASKVQITP
ncbi:hypothetical protein VNO80_01403 [Phaseolus coccineus]|uniref:Uncharacterized protein n=1 Tax=Phaseolus coccineus TaxID=3886 RepID=A0AAN9WYY7_PHACN